MNLMDLDKRRLLYGTLSVLHNRLQNCESEVFSDMTMKQHGLMESICLFEEEYPTLRQASDFVGCSYQNVKRMANELEKKGYLSIVPDSNDKRKLRLIPTDKFKELSAKKKQVVQDFMKSLYENISEKDMQITLTTAQTMITNIQKMKSEEGKDEG